MILVLRLRIIAPLCTYSAINFIAILFRWLLFLLLVRQIIAHLTMILCHIIPIVKILAVHFVWICFCEVKHTTLFILFFQTVPILIVVIKSSILFIVRQLLLRSKLNILNFIVLFELLVLVLLFFYQEFLLVIWLMNNRNVICRRWTWDTVRILRRFFEVRWLLLMQVVVLLLINEGLVLLFKLHVFLSQFL